MIQLATVKGKTVIVPNIVKRYTILSWNNNGWNIHGYNLFTTPECAIQEFYRMWENRKEEDRPACFKVLEMELEIPFISKNK